MKTPGRDAPLYSVSEYSTPHNSFFDDVGQASRTGAVGLGIWEKKLIGVDDTPALAAMRKAGLAATICAPAVWSVLASGLSPEPKEPEQRVKLICDGVRRLAPYRPVGILVTPGSVGGRDPKAAFDIVAEGTGVVADVAAGLGLRVAFEPIRATSGGAVTTIAQTVDLIRATGRRNIDIVFDIWHLWDQPTVREDIDRYAMSFAAVQVNDYKEPTRGWCDRTLPGLGHANVPALLRRLIDAGFVGWYDLEVFSDDGTWGTNYPDSLWHQPHERMLAAAHAAFMGEWKKAQELAGVAGGR